MRRFYGNGIRGIKSRRGEMVGKHTTCDMQMRNAHVLFFRI
jgi:hypothetical protein